MLSRLSSLPTGGEMAKIEPWQIYRVALKYLDKGFLQSIYTRSMRLFYYWAANPKHVDNSERTPLERLRIMLNAIDDIGMGEYSRAAIDYLAEPLDGGFAYKNQSKSDKGTIDGELADISIALGNLGAQVRDAFEDGRVDSAEKIRIKEAARNTKREIEQLLDAAGIDEKAENVSRYN